MIQKFLALTALLFFQNCYNYLSEDIPIITRPELKQRIPLLSVRVLSPEPEAVRKKMTAYYVKYITDSGYFGRVIAEDLRSPYHIDIYTAEVNEYEHFWTGSISTLFMIATAGLLPSVYSEERILICDFYVGDKFMGRERYRQKHTTLFGVPFFLIWETGIKEAKVIEFNKEKNMIHNMLQDYNRYL